MTRRLMRRVQSRWIARQLEQYRSVERTPENWRVLFAAFVARFPHGGLNGQPISLNQYKGHARYVERLVKEESQAASAADGDRIIDINHEGRAPPPPVQVIERRASGFDMKCETLQPKTPAPTAKQRERPRLLRTRKTAAAFAAAEGTTTRRESNPSYVPVERRSTKRARAHGAVDDDHVVIKQEGGLSQLELDRDRLATELRECQASLKRMKQSAHAWKVKYEELLQATQPRSPSTAKTSDPSFSFTMNINVDVSQNGTHVRTDHHAMQLQGLYPVDKVRRKHR